MEDKLINIFKNEQNFNNLEINNINDILLYMNRFSNNKLEIYREKLNNKLLE